VKDQFARGLACCFFVVTPAFLDRLTFQLGISSHWVILFALYLFFKKNFSLKLWIILGVVATLVLPYLAIMVSVVFFFALMGNSHFLKRLFVYVLSVFFAAYQAGLFVFGSSNVGSDGFGVYSANAFALVDPGFIAFDRAPWSTWVPDVRENGGQYEGFAFLGSGVLSIAVVLFIIQLITVRKSKVLLSGLIALPALINFVISQNAMSVLALLTFVLIAICVIQLQQYAKRDRLMVVKVCCIVSGFSLFALSNIILVGDFNFFQYEIPKYFLDRFAIARTSGRFIWLPMYFVMTVVLVAALKLFPRRAGMSLLCVALFFQISDSSQATRFISDAVTRPGADNYLPSKTWTVLGSTYKSVKFVPAAHFPRLFDTNPDFLNTSGWLWRDIGVLGQRYGWRLNSFYFGRVPETGFLAENTELNENLATGDYDRSVLYIFVGSEEWELAKKTVKNTDLIGTLDGVPIIAPGLSDCSVCDFSSFSNRSPFGSVG
jgi:hypothetical protein